MRYNLRHLRIFLAVAESHSVTLAAARFNLSQPAVTQAIHALEKQFGMPLFDHQSRGLFLRAEAKGLQSRVMRALGILDMALERISPRLILTVTNSQLEAFQAVEEYENYSLAARRIGRSQPAVHRAVAQILAESDKPLFQQTATGMSATKLGGALATAIRLSQAEINMAELDLTHQKESGPLTMVIGSMPLARSDWLPKTLARLLAVHPKLSVRIVEGPYDDLLSGLRKGRIDLLIGALRPELALADIEQTAYLNDQLTFVVRPGHPFLRVRPSGAELLDASWVIAPQGTPTRKAFHRFFGIENTPEKMQIVETSSFILMRQTLIASDFVGCISQLQAQMEVENGLLAQLDISVGESDRPIGVSTRRDWQPSRVHQEFLRILREETPKVLEPVSA